MVRLGHVAGGMQGIADGLQRRRGAELLEPVGGEVIDRLEGGGLEVAVVLLPVRAGALAVCASVVSKSSRFSSRL